MFFDNWTKEQRVEAARAKLDSVVDHLRYVLQIQANNAHIVYSPKLARQIPTSFAAHAARVPPQRCGERYAEKESVPRPACGQLTRAGLW